MALNWTPSGCHLVHISAWSSALNILSYFVSVGKNWDFTAALSDFEQLRQVHAGNLTYSSTEDRAYPLPDKEMARVGRPLLHRQSEVVQGEAHQQISQCTCLSICVMLWIYLNPLNHLCATSFSCYWKTPFKGHFPCKFNHRVLGPFARLQHWRSQQWASAGHAALHFPTTRPHCLPGGLPQLHREGPDWAVHDGGFGARRWG